MQSSFNLPSFDFSKSPLFSLPHSPSRVLRNTKKVITLANDDISFQSTNNPIVTATNVLADHSYCRPPMFSYGLPGLKANGEVNELSIQVIDPQTNKPFRLPVTLRFRVDKRHENNHDNKDDNLVCLCSDCTEETTEEDYLGWKEETETAVAAIEVDSAQHLSSDSEVTNQIDYKREEEEESSVVKLEPSSDSIFMSSVASPSIEQQYQLPQPQQSDSQAIPSLPEQLQPPIIIFSDGSRATIPLNNDNFLPYINKENNLISYSNYSRICFNTTIKNDDDVLEVAPFEPVAKKPKMPRKKRSPKPTDLVCWHCEKTYANRNTLQKHLFKMQGILPYSCLYCDAGFLLKKELRAHSCDQKVAADQVELEKKLPKQHQNQQLKQASLKKESIESLLQIFSDSENEATTAVELLNSFA